MCLEVRKTCKCGRNNAQFHLRDNILSQEVISELYCPKCSDQVTLDPATMLVDNGWVIEYDMDLARFMTVSKLMLDVETIQPGYLFDSGYACWLEMYPGEKQDILDERAEILELQKTDPRRYLQEISSWNIARIHRLKADGWRKAQDA
ncbi:MAG TPA: hypothetical protein ENK84_02165 [Desulfobulbus sp.]|nr:hypothetical protein [Desulfobulbus sp.]HHD64811.1 hypothetical protein [Desulfobulbaceae bacterium]